MSVDTIAPFRTVDSAVAGRAILPGLIPAMAMAVVGSIGLSAPALGWDEHATWSAAVRSPAQIVDLARHIDGVIAPYYLFLHYWVAAFGDSVVALRLPSLIAVTGGVGLLGELGRRLFGPAAGITAGLIVVAVPQISRYAQEARAYGIAFLFAVLATLLLCRALGEPGWGRWAAYGIAIVLLGYTHMIALLILSGHAVAVAVVWWAGRDRRLVIRWVVVVTVAVVLVSPLIRLGVTQGGTQLGWIDPLTVHQVLSAPGAIFGAPAVGLMIIGLAVAARSNRPMVQLQLAGLAVLPPVLLIAVSYVASPLWVPRYVLFAVMPVALLAAVPLARRPGRTVAALVLIVAVGFETQQAVRGPGAHDGMDFRVVASTIGAHFEPGDGVVFGRVGTWSLRAGLDYELRHDRSRPDDLLTRRSAAVAGRLGAVECPGLACFDARRVWYVGARRAGDPMKDAGPALTAAFAAGYRRVGFWLIPRGTIALYEHR